MKPRTIQFLVFLLLLSIAVSRASAQETHDHDRGAMSGGDSWIWMTDANFFACYNYQERKFADFWAWESQNWIMASGERGVGRGRLSLNGMFSLEPWTIGRLVYAHGLDGPERVYAFDDSGQRQPLGASPQAFQTGESYLNSPLINLQHPHDLFMELGATYRFDGGRVKYLAGADLVGPAALGPTPFMHRGSARNNPSVPLSHHYMDSTHSSEGVVRAGVEVGSITFEASKFRGEEPDENRTNIDITPFCDSSDPGNRGCAGLRLDSWSVRGSWRRAAWSAQVSGGRIRQPEWFEPLDETRLTASIGFDGAIGSRPLAVTAAWGESRHVLNGLMLFPLDGYLLEWDLRASRDDTIYGRGESVKKEIFGLGVHPAGLLNHPRNFSTINALTIGYVREVPWLAWQGLGIGADITLHDTSQDLVEYYGSPKSYHVFVRWRMNSAAPAHVH